MAQRTQSDQPDSYMLDRDALASTRLTYQHYLLTDLQTWLIHPAVEAELTKVAHPRIADLATGNAIWAIDAAERLPNATVIGTDVSDSQFPRSDFIPQNVKLGIHDLFEQVAPEDREAYDLVHVRLTLGFIYDRDRDQLMKRIVSMVKPGGWIQWEENSGDKSDPNGGTWVLHPDGSHELRLLEFCATAFRPALVALPWIAHMDESYRALGLEQVEIARPVPRRSLAERFTELMWWTCREVCEFGVRAGAPGARERYDAATKAYREFLASGDLLVYGFQIAIGRKPLRA